MPDVIINISYYYMSLLLFVDIHGILKLFHQIDIMFFVDIFLGKAIYRKWKKGWEREEGKGKKGD